MAVSINILGFIKGKKQFLLILARLLGYYLHVTPNYFRWCLPRSRVIKDFEN